MPVLFHTFQGLRLKNWPYNCIHGVKKWWEEEFHDNRSWHAVSYAGQSIKISINAPSQLLPHHQAWTSNNLPHITELCHVNIHISSHAIIPSYQKLPCVAMSLPCVYHINRSFDQTLTHQFKHLYANLLSSNISF